MLAKTSIPQPFLEAIATLPLTGRLPLLSTSAQHLAANASFNPLLEEGQLVKVFPRPRYVTVLLSSGLVCQVGHQPLFDVQDYILACDVAALAATEQVWLVQPDATLHTFGIAAWNQTPQQRPAPGAYIWAPARAGLDPAVSHNLARFLATQPPLEHQPQAALFLMARSQTHIGAPVLSPHFFANRPLGAAVSASDWGEIGLLQTPSARMAPESHARMHISRVQPYTRVNVMFQPLSWLEGGFRYSDVSNRLYGPTDLSGNQSYKDKSIDFKARLMQESAWLPQVAVGVRDLGGTGLFSGEYLVANKRWGNLDASLGLGWGYLGSRADIKNPLASVFGSHWATRPSNTVATGTVGFGTMFKGPVALFGGVQYHVSDQWLLKAELDGNSYQAEPQTNNQPVRSRANFGVVYRQTPSIDWSIGLERGNKLMLGLTLQTDAKGLAGIHAPKLLDEPLPPIVPLANTPHELPDVEHILQTVSRVTGWKVLAVNLDSNTATLVADASTAVFVRDRVEKATRTLHTLLPSRYNRFVFQLREFAMPMATVAVDRVEWLAAQGQLRAPSLQLGSYQLHPGNSGFKQLADATVDTLKGSVRMAPSTQYVLGGPDGFLLYALGLQANVDYRLSDSTWVVGGLNARLLDNYDKFRFTAPSDLPRVRTHQREYNTTSRITLPYLQVNHVQDLGGGHFGSVYGGMLEPMFGGLGAEWYHRPWQGRVGWGLDINHVRQRGFAQDLSFRPYSVTTGHVTAYWDTGIQGLHATVSAGRYLAGDTGATLDVKKVFSNGVALGAWATKTNVSKEQFGEGSFDKGIYLNIPFDVMLPLSRPGSATVVWNPLTRDGGAKLARRLQLNEVTKLREPLNWQFNMPGPQRTGPESSLSVIDNPTPMHPLHSIGDTARKLGMQTSTIPSQAWLLAGGAVLTSSLLDRKADSWAVQHQGGKWNTMGTLASAVPFALAGGAAALYVGMGSSEEATTAETAIRAAGYTLASGLALKYAVGRARPIAGAGPTHFSGFNGDALNSSFASIHTSVAFALVTPFAQQYNQPWLYGLAATTAFGRVQKRDHWVSDTVGGALLGHAIGSMLSAQQNASGQPFSLQVTPNAVVANWKY